MAETGPIALRLLRRWIPSVIVLGVAAVYHLQWRHRMNPDGVSYIDMALQAAAGGLESWVNAYWSPLFPVILTPIFRWWNPELAGLYPLVHGLQAALFFLGYIPFRGLARELLLEPVGDSQFRRAIPLSVEWELLLAFIYIWVHARIGLQRYVTPDLLGYVLMWSLAWSGVRFVRKGTWASAGVFGLTSGLAGLTKAFYVPFGALGLGLAFLFGSKRLRVALASCLFLLVMCLWWWPVRGKYPEFPWGAAGALNRAWSTQKIGATFIHWHPELSGGPSGNGVPVHTTRLLQEEPPVFEFASPIIASYPPWYDPAYWFEGVRVKASPGQRLQRFREVLRSANRVLFYKEFMVFWVLVLGAAYYFFGGKRAFFNQSFARLTRDRGFVWLGSLALGGLGAYMTIGSIPRYWGGLLLLILLCGLVLLSDSLVFLERERVGKWGRRGFLVILLFAFFLAMRMFPWNALIAAMGPKPSSPGESVQIAQALQSADLGGLKEGQWIGYVGSSFQAYFVQLAGLRIGAEIPDKVDGPERLCRASPERQCQSLGLMIQAGMSAVLIDRGVSCGRQLISICGEQPLMRGKLISIGDIVSRIRKK